VFSSAGFHSRVYQMTFLERTVIRSEHQVSSGFWTVNSGKQELVPRCRLHETNKLVLLWWQF